ncbi:MAG: 5-methyltetrahydropteroyltriglutamate--homocysteine methyltransferase [Mycobacterium sp.]|nr:5-methyltetrahydropteroyltriglutamate--homocysteine methyltransferase [Mycobacterium sp.]
MTAVKPFTTTITGSPRMGPNRELKRAVEKYWSGKINRAELEGVAATIRRDTWSQLVAAGLDSVPVNTFSYYDQVLDTAVLVGALPPRVSDVADDLDRYFAAARGGVFEGDDVVPMEMTKWFDTNYHYLVPEIGSGTRFTLNPAKVVGELEEARAQGVPARPVIVGPITFLALSKATDGGAPIGRLDDLLAVYAELLELLADQGVEWVQLDEPVLVTDIVDIVDNAAELAERTYRLLGGLNKRPAIFVATYFGELTDALPALARTPVEAIGVDLVAGSVAPLAAVPELAGKTIVAGVVDGRNVWRTDLESALGTLATLLGSAGAVAVSTSCSTLHVPYSLEPETDLDDACAAGWRSARRRSERWSRCRAVCARGGTPSRQRSMRPMPSSHPDVPTRGCPTDGSGRASRRSRRREPRAVLPKHAARRRTSGCTFPCCRPRPSGPTRRRRRSASRAPICGPGRSTTPSTSAG